MRWILFFAVLLVLGLMLSLVWVSRWEGTRKPSVASRTEAPDEPLAERVVERPNPSPWVGDRQLPLWRWLGFDALMLIGRDSLRGHVEPRFRQRIDFDALVLIGRTDAWQRIERQVRLIDGTFEFRDLPAGWYLFQIPSRSRYELSWLEPFRPGERWLMIRLRPTFAPRGRTPRGTGR